MLKNAYLLCHPPLLVKGVGDGTEIPLTRKAYETAAAQIKAIDPEVTVIISPHCVLYADYFHISPGAGATGSFEKFNCKQARFHVSYDTKLVDAITYFAEKDNLPAGTLGERDKNLDHGTMVPLYFTHSKNIVRISLSGLSFIEHYRFGVCIKKAIESLGRRAVIIASGDMSHKLGGSYGFSEDGVAHDKFVEECINESNIRRLFSIPHEVAVNAAECGLRSIMMMCGAFDETQVTSRVLHYEAPYGVGYMTAEFRAGEKIDSLLPVLRSDKAAHIQALRRLEDPFVTLARENVEHYIKTGKTIDIPKNLPKELYENKAGVFVSIKKNGSLRGCIGTTAPTTDSIAEEIIKNGVFASTKDTRFDPIEAEELDDLSYSVDVLFPPEKISSERELDVKKYGVIVTSAANGYKRGLLLPNLDGIDTVQEQVKIAKQKGGISEKESVMLERFEVVRHH